MKREGSQGQNKTFVIALKLAQFTFLQRTSSNTLPLLLLDDIFDKLDAQRVEAIVKLVAGDHFGQILLRIRTVIIWIRFSRICREIIRYSM